MEKYILLIIVLISIILLLLNCGNSEKLVTLTPDPECPDNWVNPDTFKNTRGQCSSCEEFPLVYHHNQNCNQGTTNESGYPFLPVLPKNFKELPKEIYNSGDLSTESLMSKIESGYLIASAKDLPQLELFLQKLLHSGGSGFPNFYGVDGPVVMVVKQNGNYYYMADYPLKWGGNITNWVGVTDNPDYARSALVSARKLTEPCYPIVVVKMN